MREAPKIQYYLQVNLVNIANAQIKFRQLSLVITGNIRFERPIALSIQQFLSKVSAVLLS